MTERLFKLPSGGYRDWVGVVTLTFHDVGGFGNDILRRSSSAFTDGELDYQEKFTS